ncbi:hypothetical protein EE612_049709 [Oryza sativa]|nr:hypothetical protein EE612_049709 [Oryza sativa]
MTSKVAIEAAGRVNGPTRPSMAMPCSISVDVICAVTTKKTTMDTQTGNIRSSVFSSSTCETVHSLHGLHCAGEISSDKMAALSKNLDIYHANSLLKPHAGVSYHQAISAYDSLQLQPPPGTPLSVDSLPVSCTCKPSYQRKTGRCRTPRVASGSQNRHSTLCWPPPRQAESSTAVSRRSLRSNTS